MDLKTINRKIDSLNNQLRNLKIKQSCFNQAERKKRARNLIILGANFEILGYEKEDTAVILGFLEENIKLIDKNREYYRDVGTNLLNKRKEEKEKIKQKNVQNIENRQINSDEIKEIMFLSKKYDISTFIKNNFNKTLWETLTLKEFQFLKNNFKEDYSSF